jgi:cyanuric acid amidohydrolase
VFTREPADDDSPGLRVGRGVSSTVDPTDIGRLGQIRAVAEATERAFRDAGEPREVGCVLVKTPCLRPEHVRALGDRLRTLSTAESMGLANDASALGVAVALGEVEAAAVADDSVRRDWRLYSRVAMVSAGPELSRAEVILLGNGAEAGGEQRIGNGVIADPLDRDGVLAALAAARSGHPGGEAEPVQAFAKLILPVDDTVRGLPTSFFAEPSPATVAKAIGATLLGSVLGRTDVFVSGGERGSHQGPPGAGPVAIITRRGT